MVLGSQYDHIYNLWLMSGEYEAWAENEVCDPKSIINTLGSSVAAMMRSQLGCEVEEPEIMIPESE